MPLLFTLLIVSFEAQKFFILMSKVFVVVVAPVLFRHTNLPPDLCLPGFLDHAFLTFRLLLWLLVLKSPLLDPPTAWDSVMGHFTKAVPTPHHPQVQT